MIACRVAESTVLVCLWYQVPELYIGLQVKCVDLVVDRCTFSIYTFRFADLGGGSI